MAIIERSTTKRCPRCRQDRDTSWFSRDYHRPDGRACWCKPCSRAAWRMRSWGMVAEESDRIIASQENACPICRAPLRSDGPNNVFHRIRLDRTADGRVRGFLCNACKSGVDAFGGNPKRLSGAIEYLTR